MNRTYTVAVLALILSISLSSCREEKEGPAEKAGKQIDKAIEMAKDTLK